MEVPVLVRLHLVAGIPDPRIDHRAFDGLTRFIGDDPGNLAHGNFSRHVFSGKRICGAEAQDQANREMSHLDSFSNGRAAGSRRPELRASISALGIAANTRALLTE